MFSAEAAYVCMIKAVAIIENANKIIILFM
jgi:hypothetical protein